MFISWGSRSGVAEVGPAGLLHCNFCNQDAHFTKRVEYRVRHVYWIFRWVTERIPFTTCGNCGGAHAVNLDAQEEKEAAKAIPLWDRRGWAFGAGGIAALIATGSIAAAADHEGDKAYVAAPQVGDIYEADLAPMMSRPQAERMYAAMRVTKVDAQGVEVETAMRFYNEWRGVDRDLDDGAANAPGYYGPDRQTLAPGAVQRMFDQGILHDVRR